jgi:hypothetical protein
VTPRQGHENCKLMAKNLSIQIGLRDPNCAKTHLRASVNSNIFRGYTPGTPWQKPIHSYNFSTHSQLFCPNGESNHFHNVLTSFFPFLICNSLCHTYAVRHDVILYAVSCSLLNGCRACCFSLHNFQKRQAAVHVFAKCK